MEAGRKDGIFPGGCRLECCAADHKVYRLDFPDGCGRMTVYPVLPGLRLIFNDFRTNCAFPSEGRCPGVVEINYCWSGRFQCVMPDGRAATLGPRDFSVSDMGRPPLHSRFDAGEYSGISLVLEPALAAEPLRVILGPDGPDPEAVFCHLFERWGFLILRANAAIQSLFQSLYDAPERWRIPFYRIKAAELLLFLAKLERTDWEPAPAPYYSRDLSERMVEIERRMTEELDRRVRLESLARQYGMACATLKKRFAQVYGEPPYAYLKRRRMEAAAELLRKTDRPVGEIALGVGYQNQSKFAHAFRSIYGMTPTEYKRERRMERSG